MQDVPLIDLGDFYGENPARRRALADLVDRACRDHGFLVIGGHRVPPPLIAAAFDTARAFYDLDLAAKLALLPPPHAILRGYAPMASQNLARSRGDEVPPDLRESFLMGRPELTGAEHAHEPAAQAFYQPSIWPAAPAGFQPVYREYFHQMETLARDLMRLFALALDLDENWFDDKIDDHFGILNTINYPAVDRAPQAGQLRAGAHSDFGSLTILAQTEAAGGLEILSHDGAWILIPPIRDCFVINIGDLMAQWTNDRWRSTLHRVANPPPGAAAARRQSIGFFCHPNYDAMVECLPSCRGADGSAQYPAIRAGDYMRRKIQAVRGVKAEAA